MIVRISSLILQKLEASALAEAPNEACGLLLGTVVTGGHVVEDLVLSENVTEKDHTRSFEVDPVLHLKLQKQARAGGKQVIGVWHSHPNGNPELSDADRENSVEKGWLWLVTATKNGDITTKAYVADVSNSQEFTAAKIVAH